MPRPGDAAGFEQRVAGYRRGRHLVILTLASMVIFAAGVLRSAGRPAGITQTG